MLAKQYAKERGYNVVVDLPFRTGTTSLTTEIQKLKSAQPDWLASTVFISDALLFMRTCEELNYQVPVHLSHGAGFPETEITPGYAHQFSGIYTLLYAINKAGSTDPQKIRDTLEKIMVPDKDLLVPTVGGGFHFDAKHQNIGIVPILTQLHDGKQWTIYPKHLATRKPIYPIPAWTK